MYRYPARRMPPGACAALTCDIVDAVDTVRGGMPCKQQSARWNWQLVFDLPRCTIARLAACSMIATGCGFETAWASSQRTSSELTGLIWLQGDLQRTNKDPLNLNPPRAYRHLNKDNISPRISVLNASFNKNSKRNTVRNRCAKPKVRMQEALKLKI